MPASFRVLLSCGPVLLSLLSGLLLPLGGFTPKHTQTHR